MMTLIAIVHLLFCLLLIALVLLQDPKNSGGGAMFGGSGQNSVLGATGAETFLTRLTRWSAIIFGITCLLLTILSRPNSGSVIDSVVPTSQPPPIAPAQPAPEGQGPNTLPQNLPQNTAPKNAPVQPQ